MIYGNEGGRQVEQYQGQWFHLLTMTSELHFLLREELSQFNGRPYMPTGTGCLSYGHEYVLTAA